MKKFLKVVGIIVLLIIVGAGIFIATYQPSKYSDFGVYANLRSSTIALMQEYKMTERPITGEFKDFSMELALPYSKLFGASHLGIPLVSYESDRITAATISQFEVPPKSGYCRDFTYNLRPRFEFKAPIFHIDFMKPSPQLPGLCSMDFFGVDTENINLEAFFGQGLGDVKKAMELVENYQRTVGQGRGKITAYLNPYKTKYRMELQEPVTADEDTRKQYYETVGEAFRLSLKAYLKSLYRLQPDPAYAKRHEEKTRAFVQALYDNDFAVNMGKKIFKENFKKFWIDGFWNLQIDMKEK